MARKRGAKEEQGITVVLDKMNTQRVWAEKRVLVNLGGFASYAILYGLEDVVKEKETLRGAMRRLKKQIEDQVNEDLDEVEDVSKKIPRPPKPKKGRK